MSNESWQERTKRIRDERAAQFKAAQRKELRDKIKVGVLGAVVIALAIAAIFALSALIFKAVVWNLGVVGLAAALGAPVGKIGFWTALGGVFVVMMIGQMLHGPVKIERNKD